MNSEGRCPEPQTMAAFIEGTLPAETRRAVLAHLDGCDECMSVIDIGNQVFDEEQRQSPSRNAWLVGVAAAVVIAIGLSFALWNKVGWRFGGPSMARLVAEAPRSARSAEARLSGGFPWAAYQGPNRTSEPGVDEERMKMSGLAADAIGRARQSTSADAKQVAGVAMILADQPEASIEWLEAAATRNPGSAQIWSDLAAAQDAATIRTGEASRFPTALAAADHALRIEPRLPEALFNRALILEHMRLTSSARQAWEQYLQVDPGSAWAKEAREHLAALPPTNGTLLFEGMRPRLETAALGGQHAEVIRICSANSERCRAFGEAVYLGAWGDALAKSDDAQAERNLTIARAIGDALAATTGESLLRDAVHAIDTAQPADRAALAAAHRQYTHGRILYSQHRPAEAEPLLREAAAGFGSTPMSLVARYYAANARFDQAHSAEARPELERLLAESNAHANYVALGAQVRWELALCHTAAGDWSGALELLSGAEAGFQKLNERSNLGFIETLLAETLASAGRLDDAAAARIRSYAAASSEQRGDRLPVSITSAATMELRTGRRDEARSLLALAASAAAEAHNDVLLVDVLMQSALLDADSGDLDEALRHASAARQSASRIHDLPLRERTVAYANLASAAAALPSNPAAARRYATDAIDFLAAHDLTVQLPLGYLIRARSSLSDGARSDATADLDRGLTLVAAHPIVLGNDIAAGGVFDTADALFDEAIGLAFDRGDHAAAFRYAESKNGRRAHGGGREAVTLDGLRARLAGTNTAVLELAVLPKRVVAFAISSRRADVTERPTAPDEVAALVARGRTLSDDAALRDLYTLLIKDAEPVLHTCGRVVVVAGPIFDGVPFSALIDDASQPLVARTPVALAMSATSLSAMPAPSRRSVLMISMPSGGVTAALPEEERERSEIAAAYGTSAQLVRAPATLASVVNAVPLADVVHIAGHTSRPRGNDDTALLLDGGDTATWRPIAAIPIRNHAVVVLAACETLRSPRSLQNNGMSIGAAFLAAGASEVVGTLAPISDRDAATLFPELHQRLAGGESAADALRGAQMSAMRGGNTTAWRALSVLTTRIN
jgi:hypothetical protein